MSLHRALFWGWIVLGAYNGLCARANWGLGRSALAGVGWAAAVACVVLAWRLLLLPKPEGPKR